MSPKSNTQSAPPAEPTQVYDETLSGWLQKQWDALQDQFNAWQNG